MKRRRLLVDVGNSRIKWALSADEAVSPGRPFTQHVDATWAELDRQWSGMPAPDAVHVASVAGAAMDERLAAWIRARWGLSARFALTEARCDGVSNGYKRPEELGVDRWMGVLGLHRHYPLPACLADFGTAVTLDALDAQGRHQGGLIAPGLTTMRRALSRDTHALGGARGQARPEAGLGRDTVSGIAAGCVLACAGLVEKCLAELRKEYGDSIQLVLTGGDAAAVGRHLSIPFQHDETIVLRGLLVMAERE